MAEITLQAAPALGGADLSLGGNRIVERHELAIVSVAVPLGGEAPLAAALADGWGLDMPGPRRSTAAGDIRALKTAPDQLFLIFPHPTPDAETAVQSRLQGTGYTTDQTDVWVAVEVSGPEVPAALERLCPVDLAPAAFPEGAFARTVMEHMGAIVIRLGADRFLLLSARSSARSFLHALEISFRNVLP